MNIHRAAEEAHKEANRHTRKRKKLPTFKSLETKLDRVFSEYIMRRDADEGGTTECVTCGRLAHWKDLQCGHWIKRQHRSTRWDERNCAPQDGGCNLYKSGAMDEFAGYLLRRYGKETVEELLALKRKTVKHTRADLEEMIEHFTQKVVEINNANTFNR